MNFETLMSLAPLPDPMKTKTALFIGPHPDDIEYGSGATARKLVDSGAEVHFLIVTDGGSGSRDPEMTVERLKEIRLRESKDAAAFLGVHSVEILPFPDGGIYQFHDMVKTIAEKMLAIRPDGVFTTDPLLPTETHPDHLNCGRATGAALTVAKFRLSMGRYGIEGQEPLASAVNLFYYFTDRPNVIVPVSKADMEAKFNAVLRHESQIDETFEKIKLYFYYKANTLGQKIGSLYAEGFYGLSPEHQHCFMENLSKH
jgi:LmbE family N-acetylglucosaminyl deacetylase